MSAKNLEPQFLFSKIQKIEEIGEIKKQIEIYSYLSGLMLMMTLITFIPSFIILLFLGRNENITIAHFLFIFFGLLSAILLYMSKRSEKKLKKIENN